MCSSTYDVVTVHLILWHIYQFYLRTQKIFPNHSELHPNHWIIDWSFCELKMLYLFNLINSVAWNVLAGNWAISCITILFYKKLVKVSGNLLNTYIWKRHWWQVRVMSHSCSHMLALELNPTAQLHGSAYCTYNHVKNRRNPSLISSHDEYCYIIISWKMELSHHHGPTHSYYAGFFYLLMQGKSLKW